MCSTKIKSVLIDLSGTLHIDNFAIPGSIDALKRLKESGLKYKFVTNTTKESQNYLLNRLKTLGFDVQKEEIFTSLLAAKDYVKMQNLKPFLMIDDAAFEDFNEIQNCNEDTTKGNAVVVGLAPEKFDYDSMNKAFNMLLNGAKLIAVHKSRYYKRKDDLALGPGPFVTGLEYATDVKAVVVGKPEEKFFLSALESFNCKPNEAVMIGDDVRDDIGGAQSSGLKGILVQTGKYRSGDENKINPLPNYVMPSFTEAIDFILKNLI